MINLFQHQQQALDETEGKNRVAYYLDMGLGKTFVGSEKALKLNSRVNLLVCQCSKVQDWIEHMTENYAMNHCWMIYDMTKKNEFDWFMKAAMEVDTINLSFDLYYQREWSWDDVSAYVTEAINGYFLELAQSWADQNEALVVRISQVESRLLGITGILDIANTKINGEAANCTLTLDHIPVLGTIEPGTIVISGYDAVWAASVKSEYCEQFENKIATKPEG